MRRILLGGCIVTAVAVHLGTRQLPLPITDGPAYERLPCIPFEYHPNKHFLTKTPKTIGIIGGGSAGLVAAKVLSQQGYNVEVLEKGERTGGVWADNYENAGLQAPFQHYHMPDHTFPRYTETYPKLEAVRAFLDAYVERFNLKPKISLNSEVAEVTQSADGDWTVSLKNGAKKQYDFLVLSTGLFHKPHVPNFPGLSSFKGTALHSMSFKDAKTLCKGKKVVVVGGGKSAYDALNLSSQYSASTTSIMRTRVWSVPASLNIFGISAFGLLNSQLSEILNPAPDLPKTWVNTLLQPVADLYWKHIEEELKKGLPDSLMPQTDLRLQRNDILILRDPEVVSKVADGEIQVVTGEVDKITPEGIIVGGKAIPADVLVFATGFDTTTFGFEKPDEYLWLYRGVLIPEVRNFATIGFGAVVLPQLKNSLQSMWLVDVLRGRVELPSQQAMREDIELRKEARVKVLSGYGPSMAYAWPPFFYYNSLLRDMGLQIRRKPTYMAYLLESLDPLEYKTVITHHV